MGKNLLHTHSGYAHHYIDSSFIQQMWQKKSSDSITKMQNKERQLYQQFGATDFQGFRSVLQALLLPQDLQVLRRFEAENLSNELQRFSLQQQDLYKQEIEIIFDFSQLDKLHLSKELEGFQKGPKATDDAIRTTYEVGAIKNIINKQFGRKFHVGSSFEKNIDVAVHQLLTSGVIQISIGKPNGAGDYKYNETYVVHEIPNFPWGVTKDIYKTAKRENNTIILSEIEKAIKQIYLFLQNELAATASSELKQAIRSTWIRLCRDGNDPALFFSGGKTNSFISGVQGALGEFQAALLFEYISLKAGKNALATIKGSTRLENLTKEQARTDVEIFQAFGLQVKNFVTIEKEVEGGKYKSFLQDIHTRIHPDKVAKYLDSSIQEDFLGFMANVYFNQSYYDQQYAKTSALLFSLREWLGEIMNMAVDDAVEDTVTFYVISGKYLVPCSVILQAADSIGLTNQIQIKSSFKRKTNEEFSMEGGDQPVYEKYWSKETGYWEPTNKNKETFQNLISSTISIQTNFNFFDEIEKYAIW